jgi:hypothetical protein
MAAHMLNGYRAAGSSDSRPQNVGSGFTYWNTDSGKLEVCTGLNEWADVGGPGVLAPTDKGKTEKAKKK